MLVSVVIPTRNRLQLLNRAVSSVLQQAEAEIEVLIVDEGSSDGTREWQIAHADERVTYLRNDRPTGVARARNRGIANARGEWVAFLDDDDIWAPTKVGAQLAACAAAGADFSYTGLVVTDPSLRSRTISLPPPAQSLERDLLGTNVIGAPSSVIVRRSLLDRVGDFDPSYSILADWDLWLRLAAGGRAAACEAPLTAYLTHPENMHLDVDGALSEFRRLRVKHAALAEGMNVRLGDERWWGWVASSLRRTDHRFRGAALFLWLGLRHAEPRFVARAGATLAGTRAAARVRALAPPGEQPDGQSNPSSASWLDAFVEAAPTR